MGWAQVCVQACALGGAPGPLPDPLLPPAGSVGGREERDRHHEPVEPRQPDPAL